MKKNNLKLISFCAFVALVMGGVFFWKATSTSSTSNTQEFYQGVRNALSEINLPDSNNAVAINSAADNFSNFINYRSGVQINQSNKNLLTQSEQSAWSNSKRITKADLAQILTDVSFERLVALSDSDINNMAETLRGFNPPGGLPSSYQSIRGSVKVRADGEGAMMPNQFIGQLKSTRDTFVEGSSTKVIEMTRAALYNRMLVELSERVDYLNEADPDFFGETKGSMTPMQAMLLTYSVVSDDMLVGNQNELQQKVTEVQQLASGFGTEPYPSAQGSKAYGANGYVYSSPTNLLLDDSTTSKILNLIKQKGGF